MKPAREQKGYIRYINSPLFRQHDLRTNDAIKDEVFGSLAFISEVEEVGKTFLKAHGQKHNIRKSYLQIQAFIRQAKTFYNAAEFLDLRASSLIYYYSFLNLVKSYICITNPTLVKGRVSHGLRYKFNPRLLSNQFVHSDRGVFPLFYRLVTQHQLPNKTPLKIVRILGYVSDVSVEYELGQFGTRRVSPCKLALCVNQSSNQLYALLGVLEFRHLNKFKNFMSNFHGYFDEVNIPNHSAREIFNIMGEDKRRYSFFESKKEYPFKTNDVIPVDEMSNEIYDAIKNLFSWNVYKDEFDFHFSAPLRQDFQIPMREILSIYICMFYLGSLVRYYPRYLDKIFASRDGWIVERFVKTAPITFLRQIRNLIDGRNFVYRSR